MKHLILARIVVGVTVGLILAALPLQSANSTPLAELKERFGKPLKSSVDHGQFVQLKKTFARPQDVTAACIECHNGRAQEVMQSTHWQWERLEYVEGKGIRRIGKRNILNNYCIGISTNEPSCNKCHIGYGYGDPSFNFSDSLNIDCLSCHDNSDTYLKASGGSGMPDPGVDLGFVARSVGRPRRANCGTCHFFGGGGNNVKHGDLEKSMFEPSRDVDVHMASEGLNMLCVDCHTAKQHKILGKAYSISSMNRDRVECETCHGKLPHDDDLINKHMLKVACQTCHIPIYAKVNPTKLYWDWSTAGKTEDGKFCEVKDSLGNDTYLTIKGSFVWGRQITPEYRWFNGRVGHYLLGETFDPSQTLSVNQLHGSYDDLDSKIIPVKIHRGRQIYDTKYNYLIQPKTYSKTPGDSGFWKELDWIKASTAGMKAVNLPFSGQYDFINTEMFWPVNHMVSAKTESVKCAECHTRHGSRLASLTDFYLPGRDSNRIIEFLGSWAIVLTIFGVLGHGLVRFITREKVHPFELVNQVYLYQVFERFWHWTQAILIIFMALTGFEVHGSYKFFGFENAVRYHNAAAYTFLVLIAFSIFWHFTTGEWRQYLPTGKNLRAQIEYYLIGIFRHAPHPTRKTNLSKLNPLQRLVYLGLKVLVIPLMVTSGLIYMFYRYPQRYEVASLNIKGLTLVALIHTIGAFLLVTFLAAHLYLITTGHTLTSNLKAMITGSEELPAEEESPAKSKPSQTIA
jgi:octaheme c-type cytochrome (tetrathionate reductase family)